MVGNFLEMELAKGGSAVSIIKLVSLMIDEAQEMRASDIHIDPQRESLRIRYRVDGWLSDRCLVSKRFHQEIISRIKVMSGLRTDEHQAPQDGRFRAGSDASPIDVRVSVMPTYHGENVVMRLLSDKNEMFTLETLGFSSENAQKIFEAIKKPYGMILATGPTGSGKTTTLYTLLKILNTPQVSIITVEDPVEYAIDGIEQIQVNPRTGLAFANGLRSILRQDPNIIMVGEVRDAETAGIAVNTALTGHLVLSTLHTNDASESIRRIVDVFPLAYQSQVSTQLSFTLSGVINQLLLPSTEEKGNTRVLSTEVMIVTPAIRSMIRENKVEHIYSHIQMGTKQGMKTMNQSLYELIMRNRISEEEALANTTKGKELSSLLAEA